MDRAERSTTRSTGLTTRPIETKIPAVTKSSAILIGLLFLAAAINYIDRGSLSIAAPRLQVELGMSPSQMGYLLSAFFWSYMAFQAVSGWLADRVPVNRLFTFGFVLWSGATLASGFAQSVVVLGALRLLLGIGESVGFPCYSKVIVRGFRPDQRGLPNALLDAGTKVGPALGTMVGAYLVSAYSWRVMFVALGAGSLLWLIPWLIWAPKPGSEADESTAAGRQHVPLSAVVRRRDAWGTFLGNFSYT
jgi:MFS transporter, ACS family, D-galactonate transporter